MTSPRAILKKYGIHPIKGLGQSFLIDNNITDKIVTVSGITRDDIVVEIGAGLGVMTAMIADRARKVIALEIDPKLIIVLQEELKHLHNVDILKQDVLKYDFTSAFKEDGYHERTGSKVTVVGNIPYNISSQILLKMIALRKHVSSMTFMFQKEVAERITASPGTKQYGLLSVLTFLYTMPSRIMTVPASCFFPKPKVDSIVLKMKVRQQPLWEIKDESLFFQVVKTAFSKRRKTLINNFKSSEFVQLPGSDIHDLFVSAGIDGQRRGEALTVEEFVRLSDAIFTVQNS
ncbi:MAG: 16S rRNA (adenine(1518)-N(6)/adenine(1519)-N(6))-dimethyltransferase RsmA [Deltaproteobacteria bacterium]|nr:16S rRNA (adenine(1518)-N(6)/adenine(1519)-N(6))-dimethyltransferase RsmA [Deltaproteobacteria bacterium]